MLKLQARPDGLEIIHHRYWAGAGRVGSFSIQRLAEMCRRTYARVPEAFRMPLLSDPQFEDRLRRYPNVVFSGSEGRAGFLTCSDPVAIDGLRYRKLGPIGLDDDLNNPISKGLLLRSLRTALQSGVLERSIVYCVMAPARQSLISRILISCLGFQPNADVDLNERLLQAFVHRYGVMTKSRPATARGIEYVASDKPYPLSVLLLRPA
jgi:hypothetical protein